MLRRRHVQCIPAAVLRTLARRLPRWLKATLAATVGVYAVYLFAANVILRTRLLRGWLRADDGSLVVDYRSARSLYPGHIVVHDLAIRFEDENIQLAVGLDRADVDIALWKLTRRMARFENVRARGVVYRMRLKQDRVEGNEQRLAAFPPIEGFADPPLHTPPKPKPEKEEKSWAIELREVDASVREVWTLEAHLRGDAHLNGGFRMGDTVDVTPSHMRVHSGTLSLGEREVMRGNGWTLDVQIDPFVPADTHGIDVLRFISFNLRQQGEVVSIAPVGETYLASGWKLEGGGGPLAIDVHVDHGNVQPDARMTYRSADVGLRAPGLAVKGDVDTTVRVDTTKGAPHVTAEATTKQATMSPPTALTNVRADLDFDGVDVTAPVIARAGGSVGAARISDLRTWQAIAGDAVTFNGGSVTTSARGEYRKGALDGHVDVSLDRAAMAVGPFSFVASGTTATDVESKDVEREIALPNARVDARDIAVKLLDGHAKGMWLRARSSDAHFATSGKSAADAHVEVVSGPGDQNLKIFTRLASIPDIAADITHGQTLAARVHLRVRPGDIGVDILTAKDGILGGRGRIHKADEKRPAGAFLVSVGPVTAGLDIDNGEVSVRPLAGGEWLDETLTKR